MLLTPHERIELARSGICTEGNVSFELFRPKLFLVNQIANIFLLFTFGATSPMLSFVIVSAILIHTMYITLVIGRFVQKEAESERRGRKQGALGGIINESNRIGGIDQLNEECQGFDAHILQNTRWLLLSLSSAFYSYFIFDMYGDVADWNNALAPSLLMFLSPLFIFFSERLYSSFSSGAMSASIGSISQTQAADNASAGDLIKGIEMRPSTAVTNPLFKAGSTGAGGGEGLAASMSQAKQGDFIPERIDTHHVVTNVKTTSSFERHDKKVIRPRKFDVNRLK